MTKLLLVTLAGCTLVSRAPPPDIHYFSPEAAQVAVAARDGAPCGRLRLGRFDRSDHLRYRIVQRTSDVELALYETRRWTEQPHEYVRRALRDALFGGRALEQAVIGPAPTLDVEILAFDDVVAPRHVGRVQLRFTLRDERRVLASDRVTAEHAVSGTDFAGVVSAIGAAMTEATRRLADDVAREVCTRREPAARAAPVLRGPRGRARPGAGTGVAVAGCEMSRLRHVASSLLDRSLQPAPAGAA